MRMAVDATPERRDAMRCDAMRLTLIAGHQRASEMAVDARRGFRCTDFS
jgi:hypothetical protein